jgi:HK97 family phage major capsid protein
MPAPDFETKAYGADASLALDEMNRTFETYRDTSDAALADAAQRRADVLTEEKLARIDRALDEHRERLDRIVLRAERPVLAQPGTTSRSAGELQHKAAFELYVRSGESVGLKSLEAKALSSGSGPDGGYLVPPPAERELLRRMAMISPIRSIASVREISSASFKKAFSTGGPAAGWVAETAARPQTNSPVLAELNFPAMELYAMPSATQTLLDDGVIDVEAWIADEIDTVFAEQEAAAFVTGDGVNKPTGFLNPAKVAQSAWTWGKLGYVPTGVSGGLPVANTATGVGPSDALVDLIYALKRGYRQNATFVMNRKTQSAIRKLKATTGEYLWQPPVAAGQNATLMGFPLVEAEEMPDIAADSTAVAFGDFRRGYLVVDRVGVRVLRDPYSAKPYVLFYTTKRVGGGVQDFDAIKLLKFGTA